MAVSTAERNARLSSLETAIKAWADGRRKYLKQQVTLSKRLLKGRTGAERLNQASIESATSLTVDQINQFLTGE